MRVFGLWMFFLLLASPIATPRATARQLSLESANSVDWLSPSNGIIEFRDRLTTAVYHQDLAAIQDLYETNGIDSDVLKFEFARWKQLLELHSKDSMGLWMKELDRLPPQARQNWTRVARQLTEREVTHLVFLNFSGRGLFELSLPLVVVKGKLMIVPSEKRRNGPVYKPIGHPNGSRPVSARTNEIPTVPVPRR